MALLSVVATALLPLVSLGQKEWQQELVSDWNSIDTKANFLDWQTAFGRSYKDNNEESYRFSIFMSNWEKIYKHNTYGHSSYRMKLNQFGDLTESEFRIKVFGSESGCLKDRSNTKESNLYRLNEYKSKPKYSDSIPTSIDWTDIDGLSYVTPVKNQADCGSCWAFSTTGSLESFYAIATNTTGDDIIELSEQQLVDCVYDIPDGCQGGLQEDAFTYIAKEGGLCTEDEYPYTGRDGVCTASTCGTLYNDITGYISVHKDNETDLMEAIAIGPVAVSIDAAGFGWTFYSSGIYSDECGIELDHGVLGVGYGADDEGNEYWKIKNSWGKTWGEDGYILICKDCDKDGEYGECGVLRDNTYPVLPSSV